MDLRKEALKFSKEVIAYHHYSLKFDSQEVSERFKDVRFILIAGCARRARRQASYLAENLFNGSPVLVSDHGMGSASMSIAVHELLLMSQAAKIMDKIVMIRFGTCGGLGVSVGSLCITSKAYTPLFEDFVELKIVGRRIIRPAVIDLNTAQSLYKLASESKGKVLNKLGPFDVFIGATIAADDFYEEQARTIGAICDHTQEDLERYLRRAREEFKVINMEMESVRLASMCHKVNVSFAVVCVSLNNRLEEEDKHDLSGENMRLFEERLFWLNSIFIESTWKKNNSL